MNSKEKRAMIHRKLEVMKECYRLRDPENFDRFYDTFFDRRRLPILIGTDNGPWFRTMGQIRWLIGYDWEKWGKVEIDTWNFRIHETDNLDLVRVRGVLDFGEDRVWDLDILMVFSKNEKDYPCRLMQFKIPRNELRPVVILNKSEEEQTKSEKEMRDLMNLNGMVGADLMRDHLVERITSVIRDQRPYLEGLDIRKELLYLEECGDGFLFALTGFCIHSELNALMPLRVVGIGQGYEILDMEFSHPFVSSLG